MNKKIIGIFALLIMIVGTGAVAFAQPSFKGGFGDNEGGKFIPGDENRKFGHMSLKGKFPMRGPGIDRDSEEFQAMMDMMNELREARQAYDEDPTEENEASLVEKVKEMFTTKTGLKIDGLTTLKETIADSEDLTDEEKQEKIENIDTHISFLEEMQTQMDSAENVEDLEQIREEMRENRDELGFGHRGRPGNGFCREPLSAEGTPWDQEV